MELSWAHSELVVEIFKLSGLRALLEWKAVSRAALETASLVEEQVVTAFPAAVFVARRGRSTAAASDGSDDGEGGDGAIGDEDALLHPHNFDSSDADSAARLDRHRRSCVSSAEGRDRRSDHDFLGLSAGEVEALTARLRSAKWGAEALPFAGVIGGDLYACSSWRSQLPTALGGAIAGRREDERSRPVWQEQRRRVSSTATAEKERGALPEGFGLRLPGFEPAQDFFIPALSSGCTGAAVTILGGEVYACGGWYADEDSEPGTEVYVLETDSWEKVEVWPMRVECRVWACADELTSQVFVPSPFLASSEALPGALDDPWGLLRPGNGGRDDDDDEKDLRPLIFQGPPPRGIHRLRRNLGCPMRGAECFDASAGAWRWLPPMRESRAEASLTALGGRLYCCGGFGWNAKPLHSVERFDPASNAWEELPPMREARALAAARALPGGRLLVCGGIGEDRLALQSAEYFDPQTRTWTSAADPGVAAGATVTGVAITGSGSGGEGTVGVVRTARGS